MCFYYKDLNNIYDISFYLNLHVNVTSLMTIIIYVNSDFNIQNCNIFF